MGCEVKGGKGVRAMVGNTSSGTCTREEEVRSVCGPKLIDQIVFKRRVKKLGCVLDSLWVFLFVKFLKLSLIKLL